jgi:hypothetical protein
LDTVGLDKTDFSVGEFDKLERKSPADIDFGNESDLVPKSPDEVLRGNAGITGGSGVCDVSGVGRLSGVENPEFPFEFTSPFVLGSPFVRAGISGFGN